MTKTKSFPFPSHKRACVLFASLLMLIYFYSSYLSYVWLLCFLTIPLCVCTECSLFTFFLVAKFQLLGNLYRRPVVVAGRMCGTTCKSQ